MPNRSLSPRARIIARVLVGAFFVVEFVLVAFSTRGSIIRGVLVGVDLIVLVGVIILVVLTVRRSRRSR